MNPPLHGRRFSAQLMTSTSQSPAVPILRDTFAGFIVFLVAIPLCLGIALASGVPATAGIIGGAVGGIVVGLLSGSQLSVAGPAAGLAAFVLAELARVGSFEAFLAALALSGIFQIAFGMLKAGLLADYIPTNVTKGLLVAVGLILILKQIPHLLGHDADFEGDMAFLQRDGLNTFSELWASLSDIHSGAALVGLICLAIMIAWEFTPLRKALIPGHLLVVAIAIALNAIFQRMAPNLAISGSHLVSVPSIRGGESIFHWPDLSALARPAVWQTAITLAILSSLKSLINLEATDKIDPLKRIGPPNRELFAQGAGNLVCGLIGGMPITSVLVRSSVNVNAGAVSNRSAIIHGVLLAASMVFLAGFLNTIPLSALAAILVVTGAKLAKVSLFSDMFRAGRSQYIPFLVTIVAIFFTDLLTGIIIGLIVSACFILYSNLQRGFHMVKEAHVGGPVTRLELANQVTFLNRAALARAFAGFEKGSHVVLDARTTDYIDPDILEIIRLFRNEQAPARGIQVSTIGFQERYAVADEIQYVDVTTRDVQHQATPQAVLQLLKEGNDRFVAGKRLNRDLIRQVGVTAAGQHPLAVVLGCIDSRASTELIFDLGLGDIFCIRIAGNVAAEKVLGSMEYACQVAGAKVIVVKGHTKCGAVAAACEFVRKNLDPTEATGCTHLAALTNRIGRAVHDIAARPESANLDPAAFADIVAAQNVRRTMEFILESSPGIRRMVEAGSVLLVGAMYDVRTGKVDFLDHEPSAQPATPAHSAA